MSLPLMNKAPKNFLILFFLMLAVGCKSSSSFNFGAYSEAEKFYEKKKYEKAIVKYGEYLRENPDGNMAVISYYYTAKSYDALGQLDKARELYEKIAKEHPSLVWANFSKARLEELSAESKSAHRTG